MTWDQTGDNCLDCNGKWEGNAHTAEFVHDDDCPATETCSVCTDMVLDKDLIEHDAGRVCRRCKDELDDRDEGIDRGAELSYWCNSSSVTGIFQGM